MSADVEQIGNDFAEGIEFNHIHYLDWAARVALDMHGLVNEPDGPDLIGLAQRCDDRLLSLAGGSATEYYVSEARKRAAKYEQ
jgi:hypothetical protein